MADVTDTVVRGARALTPGVQRIVRSGARAANDVAISMASGLGDLWDSAGGAAETAANAGRVKPGDGAFGRTDTIEPLGVPDTVGEWRLNPMTRQREWIQSPTSNVNVRQAAVQSGYTPVTVPSRVQPASSTASWAAQLPTTPSGSQATVGTRNNTNAVEEFEREKSIARENATRYAGIIQQHSNEIDEYNRQMLAAINDGAMEVAARYDEKISELRGRIAEAKQGLAGAMAAYKHYSEQVGPAYQAAVESAQAGVGAQKDALAGRADAVVADIEAGVAAETETVEEVAELIGTDMELSDSLRDAVGMFEDMVSDAARGRIEDVDRLSAAAALFAEKQSKAIQAQDEFLTDVEREKLEIQIQSQIDNMLDNVAQLEKDKTQAVQDALDQYDPLTGFDSPDEAWEYVLGQFILSQGWSIEDEDAIRGLMGQMNGVTDRAGAQEWLRENMLPQARLGVLEEYFQKHYGDRDIPQAYLPWLNEIAGDPTSSNSQRHIANLRDLLQIGEFDQDFVSAMFRDEERQFDQVLDVFDLYGSHMKKWNDARAATARSGGGQAGVNNYANRNDPQYVQRRTVGVPSFIAQVQQAFPWSANTGREYFGGVTSSYKGALRSPQMTGGGRASDSDHLSGGAIDIYAPTVADLEAIERWAASQPGVASVVYSGNKYHETGKAGGASAGNNGRGHVHVSLALGYW